jgi:hypothetical protein
VYSVGPDGADDGGVDPPADAPRKPAVGFDEVRDLKLQPAPVRARAGQTPAK